MKNFRKVLALILVVATLFSFAAMASAKSTEDYTDGEKVNYTEAVDVLSTIGILEGYPDGSFGPTKNITRAEMAKMVAVLSNAGDDVSALYASACTFADAKNSWAASYIAYCNQTGIVAGRSATTFDPNANVTGIETAKMLLCVLGFDAKEQGYVGTNWKTNILRDAKNFGLLVDFAESYDIAKAITREEAAQMFLNALKAQIVVGTLSNNVVNVSNSLYNKGGIVKLTLTDANKEGFVLVYGNVIVAPQPLASIYKNLSVSFGQDCFGRPGTTWKYTDARGKVLLNKFFVAASDKVYTSYANLPSDYKTLAAATNTALDPNYKAVVYVDGALQTYVANTAKQQTATQVALAAVRDMSGNGIRVETYVDEVDKMVYVIVINPYWGVVTDVSKLKDTFTVNGKTYSRGGQAINKYDVVLYHLCNGSLNHTGTPAIGTLHDVTVVTPVTADVVYTRAYVGDPDSDYFTADKDYFYNAKVALADRLGANDKGSTRYVYLDEYGYVILTGAPSVKSYYAYVEEDSVVKTKDKETLTSSGWKSTYTYTGTFAIYGDEAGAVEPETLKIFSDNMDANTAYDVVDLLNDTATATGSTGRLVKYNVDGQGRVVLTSPAVFGQWAPAGTQVSAYKNVLKNGSVYANADTKFMIRSTNPANGAWTYEEVIGYQNLKETYIAEEIQLRGQTVSSIQYIDADGNGIAEYVFIDAPYAKVSATFLLLDKTYVANSVTVANWLGYDNYEGWRALVDGKEAVVLFKKGVVDDTARDAVHTGVLYTGANLVRNADMKYDDNLPLYVAADECEDIFVVETQEMELNVASNGEIQIKTLYVNGTYHWEICAKDFEVFYIGTAWNGTYITTDGYVKVTADLYEDLLGNGQYVTGYLLYNENDEVTAVYITGNVLTNP